MPPMPYHLGQKWQYLPLLSQVVGQEWHILQFCFSDCIIIKTNDCELRHCIMQSDVCLCVRPNFKGLASIHPKAGNIL